MSVNQSGLRRTVGKYEGDSVPKGIRNADLIAGAIFVGLNIIAGLGEVTVIFAKYGRAHSGIAFLYKTFCYPASLFMSKFLSLQGDPLYVWIVAQLVFMVTTLVLWIFFLITSSIFKAFKV